MNKLLNDYQLLELENAELRNRIAELKAKPKYPSIVFNLKQEGHINHLNKYIIYDECGYYVNSFCAENDEKAIEFFNYYKKNYKPQVTEVIRNGFTDNILHSLVRYTSYIIQDCTFVPLTYYVVRANKEKVADYDNNITEEEAIAKYQADIDNYIRNYNKTNSRIII